MRVACPWFEPQAEMDGPRPARTPLGSLFTGVCHAGDQVRVPPEHLLREPCNFGYGRRVCPHFPPQSEADAVRFSTRKGRLIWILEKDYAPLSHGLCDDAMPKEHMQRQADVAKQRWLTT